MHTYFHSVTLDKDKCKGCINCIKRCPTEAIRVRHGKAKIIKERCIDCGECIRVCPYHAKSAITNPLSDTKNFKYNIAIPAPSLYGQFNKVYDVNVILTALKKLGFDDVYEVARAAEIVTIATRDLIYQKKVKFPIISSACPAVVKLIRTRFPSLIDNVLSVLSPMEVSAKLARDKAVQQTGLSPADIGVFFISPCAAKVTIVKNPLTIEKSDVDGVISIKDIYLPLLKEVKGIEVAEKLASAGTSGVGWARSGGEAVALGNDEYIAVDGIDNVIKVLEELEDDQLKGIKFVEAGACVGGCVGGPLAVMNGFVAKTRIKSLMKNLTGYGMDNNIPDISLDEISYTKPLEYNDIMLLDDDIITAMKKMERIEEIAEELPKLDCGSCGAPSCHALAEDIVRGFASETDCIHKLRDRIHSLAKELGAIDVNRES